MDLEELLKEGVISPATAAWLGPLWKQEQEESRQLQEQAEGRFFGGDNDDECESADDLMIEDATLTLKGMSVPYCRDEQSTGHGNRVWHASIATCFYLQSLSSRESSSLKSFELGAGTAIPSLFLAQLLSKAEMTTRPLIHVTDSKQYRNIRQILQSIGRQSTLVRQKVQFLVSPHNWGERLYGNDQDSFFHDECPTKSRNEYNLVIVSDCIYNPTYHEALLESIAATLKFPDEGSGIGGGRVLVSFSLHGNTGDDTVWRFLDLAANKSSNDKRWKLQVHPVTDLPQDDKDSIESIGRGGWHMEETMKQLDLWVGNLDPKRWIAYLYELTWTPSDR